MELERAGTPRGWSILVGRGPWREKLTSFPELAVEVDRDTRVGWWSMLVIEDQRGTTWMSNARPAATVSGAVSESASMASTTTIRRSIATKNDEGQETFVQHAAIGAIS